MSLANDWLRTRPRPSKSHRTNEAIMNDSADASTVGFKRPPPHRQFPKGTSGNPRGRPKKTVKPLSARRFRREIIKQTRAEVRLCADVLIGSITRIIGRMPEVNETSPPPSAHTRGISASQGFPKPGGPPFDRPCPTHEFRHVFRMREHRYDAAPAGSLVIAVGGLRGFSRLGGAPARLPPDPITR